MPTGPRQCESFKARGVGSRLNGWLRSVSAHRLDPTSTIRAEVEDVLGGAADQTDGCTDRIGDVEICRTMEQRRARESRGQRGTRLDNLRCHSDAGSQYASIRYSERLDEIGAQPAIGSVGDAYDNALAESVNALYKTELVRGPNRGPWKTIDSLELATLNWVHWHKTQPDSLQQTPCDSMHSPSPPHRDTRVSRPTPIKPAQPLQFFYPTKTFLSTSPVKRRIEHKMIQPLAVITTVAALLVAAFGGTASAATPDDCTFPTTWGVCQVVTNRVWAFTPVGGQLSTAKLQQISVNATAGNTVGRTLDAFDWNGSATTSYGSSSIGTAGSTTYRAIGGIDGSTVKVTSASGSLYDTPFSLTCPNATYLVCVTPRVWARKINSNPQAFTGLATIESRPLIIKIMNLTNQPLERSSQPRGTGVIRDLQVNPSPRTIPALTDGLAGTAYYSFYRDASTPNNVTMSYQFADGAMSKALTGGVLDINVDVAADGSTSASQCTTPEGLPLTVECKVTMLGIADGVLTALVSVGV